MNQNSDSIDTNNNKINETENPLLVIETNTDFSNVSSNFVDTQQLNNNSIQTGSITDTIDNDEKDAPNAPQDETALIPDANSASWLKSINDIAADTSTTDDSSIVHSNKRNFVELTHTEYRALTHQLKIATSERRKLAALLSNEEGMNKHLHHTIDQQSKQIADLIIRNHQKHTKITLMQDLLDKDSMSTLNIKLGEHALNTNPHKRRKIDDVKGADTGTNKSDSVGLIPKKKPPICYSYKSQKTW